MKTARARLILTIVTFFIALTGCGSDSGGSLSDATSSTSKWVGNYKLTGIMALDRTYYEASRYTVNSGSCGFKLSDNSDGWHQLLETNDCKLKDEYGDTYPIVYSGSYKIKIDTYGSISEVDTSSTGTSSNTTSTSTLLKIDVTFGTSSAVMKTVVRLGSGVIVDYTYSYSKQ